MTETRTNRAESPVLPATASIHGLGDLPLGSPQSRAAVRSLIEARGASEEEGMLLVVRHIGGPAPRAPNAYAISACLDNPACAITSAGIPRAE